MLVASAHAGGSCCERRFLLGYMVWVGFMVWVGSVVWVGSAVWK